MSKKRDLIKQWRSRAVERSAMAEALETKPMTSGGFRDDTTYELHRQHIECLRVMADTFNICANELDKA